MRSSRARERPRLASAAMVLGLSGAIAAAYGALLPPRDALEQIDAARRPDEATVAHLRHVIQAWPGDVRARVLLVKQLLGLGRFREARAALAPLLASADPAVADEAVLLAIDVDAADAMQRDPGTPGRVALEEALAARIEQARARALGAKALERLVEVALAISRPDLAADLYATLTMTDEARGAAWQEETAKALLASDRPAQAALLYYDLSTETTDDEEARRLVLAAIAALDAANLNDSSLVLLRAALERFPRDRALLDRALILAIGHGEHALARDLGERLLALEPDDLGRVRQQVTLDLRVGDLRAARARAEQVVAKAPEDRDARAMLARLDQWTGDDPGALAQWAALASRDATGEAAREARRLAALLHDPRIAAALSGALRPGSRVPSRLLARIVGDFEWRGDPRGAQRFLGAYAAAHEDDAEAWRMLAALDVRAGDPDAAAAARAHLRARGAATLADRIDEAALRWRGGDGAGALALLRAQRDEATPRDDAYWRELAEIAWERGDVELAADAYDALWRGGARDAGVAERIAIGRRARGDVSGAIAAAIDGWKRSGEARLILLAIETARDAADDAEVRRLMQLAARAPELRRSVAYWLTRGWIAQQDRAWRDAERAYARALAIDPSSTPARAGMLATTRAAGHTALLTHWMSAWRRDALADDALAEPYAAALVSLGRPRDAASLYARFAAAHRRDRAWIEAWADALAASGARDAATRLRRYELRRELREGALSVASGGDAANDGARGRARIAMLLGDEGEATRWARARGGADDASDALRLRWAIDDGDVRAVERLASDGDLSRRERIDALLFLGEERDAYARIDDELAASSREAPDEALLRTAADLSSRHDPRATAGGAVDQIGALGLLQADASAQMDIGAARGAARAAVVRFEGWSPGVIVPRDATEVRASVGAGWRFRRATLATEAGVNAHASGALPIASLIGTIAPARELRASGEIALDEIVEESAPLRLEGARDRVTASVTYEPTARAWGRIAGSGLRDHGRDEARVGEGVRVDAELGQRIFVGSPEWRVWGQGSVLAREVAAAPPAAFAAVLPPGSGVDAIAVRQFASAGIATGLRTAPDGGAAPLLRPRASLEAWTGWLWPAGRLAYHVRASVAVRVLASTDLAVDAYDGSDRAAVGSEGYRGASLHLTQTF